ncbi:polar tube protein 3 (PTP3) [Vairimorpha necatrix]|uniref:Polar tube protein 3 (PTP3) n=1 Tax=Vairimorpha necatrix TaxID=6039 RepID=A0AAX4J8G6_9MICR
MRKNLYLVLIVRILGRILKSDRRGSSLKRSSLRSHTIITSDTVHDDPDHVDVDLRNKNKGNRKNQHTGTVIHVRKKSVHGHHHHHHHFPPSPPEEHVRREVIRPEVSPHTGLTDEEVEKALKETPNTSAPMVYSSMKEVKPGVNPELDKTLTVQKMMEEFRNFLPKVGDATNEVLKDAGEILERAPNGDISAPYVDRNGNPTGFSYGEEAEHYIKKAAPLIATVEPLEHPLEQVNKNIDETIVGPVPSAEHTAQYEFEDLVEHGVPPEKAAKLAERIEQSITNEKAERTRLANALKDNAKESFEAANHQDLLAEIEQEKIDDANKMIETMNEETIKQTIFPQLHPIHMNEEELGFLRQLGNQLTPKEIGRRMFEAFELSKEGGGSPEDAMKAAARTGYLLSEFNNEVRKGVPPEIATDLIKERANIRDAVEQRRSFVQNNGPEIAQLVSENTKLVQEAARKIAQNPENKKEVMNELDSKMKKLASDHASYIHETSNKKNIHIPRKAADDLIDETKNINSEILHIAHSSPVVAKDIIKKGLDNSRQAAEIFHETLDYVDELEKRHSPLPKSALKLLNEAKKEQQLDEMARKSAEAEQKLKDEIAKEHKDAEVMATEEKIASENKAKKIQEEGLKAADRILKAGGTISEARAAKNFAEQKFANALASKEASIRQDVLRSLSNDVDPQKAAKIATHFATAHTGENAVGKTKDEVVKNEMEERKKEALEKAFYSDFSNEKVDILKVIPPDSTEVNISNSVIKFPLNTFIDEKPKDKGEEFVKNRTDVLSNIVRNTVTRNQVNSGLNTIQTSDGFLNMGENSNKIHVQKAVAFMKPSGKIQMEREGIDTSNWKSRHNQGERPGVPDGELYYEAEVNNADIPLPSPLNNAPGKFISNGDEQLDANYIDELHIKTGTLEQVPWNEFSDLVKPRLNLYPNEEEKIQEITELTNAMAEQRKKEELDSIKIYSFTNPDGEKHITTVPQYGITETFEEEEAMKRLSNIDPDKNIAISETPTESKKEPIINSLDNVPDDEILEKYVDNTIAEGKAKQKANRFVSPINGFTNQEDKEKSELVQTEKFDITKHMINDTSEASLVKNEMIKKTTAFANALHISKEEFVDLIKKIPDSTIYKMDKFNSEPTSNPTKILEEDFVKVLTNISSNVSSSNLISYIFNSISVVTGKPNNVSSTILEQNIVPNLKIVENVTTTRTPNGTNVTSTLEPPKPGSTVLNEVVTSGMPNISTGLNTSYPYPDPTKKPIRQQDNIVRNPGPNPLIVARPPYTQNTNTSFNIPNSPSNAIPSLIPEVSTQLPQRTPTRPPGTAGTAGTAGTPPNRGTVPVLALQPDLAPRPRLGIASSTQR